MSDFTRSESLAAGLLAVDVGSSRVKLGWYPPSAACTSELEPGELPIAAPQLPQPVETLTVSHGGELGGDGLVELGRWLEQLGVAEPRCFLASVHPTAAASLLEVLHRCSVVEPHRLSASELPVEVRVEQPERVGIDRLLNALAVNRLREPQRSAIIADLGTASTVDLIAADGAFEGGAILPGITMSATALHTGTAALPQLSLDAIGATVSALGKSTQAAIGSGLYWGAVGAVRELIEQLGQLCDTPPQVFITGGDASLVLPELASGDRSVRHVPHLVLAGISIAAQELS